MTKELIYNALISVPDLEKNMANYNNKPAVFFKTLPNDKYVDWNDSIMFPRIIYNTNWRYNPDKKTGGSIEICVFCTNENSISPEEISKGITEYLSELFLTDNSGTYCIIWDKTESFDIKDTEPIVNGTAVNFDILCFKKQEGNIPCPVWSVNEFIKGIIPESFIIGHEVLPEFVRATDKKPIIYTKVTETNNIKTNYSMAWFENKINVSVISSNIEKANKTASLIAREFSIEKETLMQNGSPYLIFEVKQNLYNYPIITVQLTLTGQYGIMREQEKSIKLNNAYFKNGH